MFMKRNLLKGGLSYMLMLVLTLVLLTARGQERTLSGTVTDSQNQPLPV